MTCHCCAIDETFDGRVAEAELARYRRKGPSGSTRRLLDALGGAGIEGATVLDIGGGVGAIALELTGAGAARGTVVEASAAYRAAARSEIERRQATERVDLVYGDFVAIAPQVPAADIVTLDKVVCCYPEMDPLLAASAAHAFQLYGISYPRDAWWVRFGVAAQNAIRRLRRRQFRVHVHSNAAIEAALRRAGLSLRSRMRGFVWIVDVYERNGHAS